MVSDEVTWSDMKYTKFMSVDDFVTLI